MYFSIARGIVESKGKFECGVNSATPFFVVIAVLLCFFWFCFESLVPFQFGLIAWQSKSNVGNWKHFSLTGNYTWTTKAKVKDLFNKGATSCVPTKWKPLLLVTHFRIEIPESCYQVRLLITYTPSSRHFSWWNRLYIKNHESTKAKRKYHNTQSTSLIDIDIVRLNCNVLI